MVTINGKSWIFGVTAERQIINGRETHCGVYHDVGRVLVDATLPLERQLELAARAAVEISRRVTSDAAEQPELIGALDLLNAPLLGRVA